jgi:hypothetical protein
MLRDPQSIRARQEGLEAAGHGPGSGCQEVQLGPPDLSQRNQAQRPVIGVESLANNLGCQGVFSAVCDPVLDGLIQELRTNPSQSAMAKIFRQAATRIASRAYAVYGMVTPWNVVTSVPVTAMTLVSGEDGPIINWEDIKVG